jgi:two-component system chemotaxis response regulator CheY/two-component system alkaline phosphatase synthesis response regulator PhoP
MNNNGRKILIVDDDDEIVRGMSVRLGAAGFQIIAACDGAEALCAVERSLPDVILLDVRMPGIDGLTVLRRLQECDETRHVPVIMLSASLCDQRTALSAGARYFLAKPFRGGELIQFVQQVMES